MRLRHLVFALAAFSLSGCGYNKIQELDEQTNQQKGNIETELMRRNDLIPNLVATVEEAASHERGTFTEVARARSGLDQSRQALANAVQGDAGTAEVSRANAAVTDNLRLYLNIAVEAYPQLQASGGFRDLQGQLAGIEEAVQNARRYYNAVVRDLNTAIMTFPANLLAGPMGFQPREFFEAAPAEREVPKVSF